MTYFTRKIHVAITLLLITSISYVYGDYCNPLTCAESENYCCSQQVSLGRGFISADLLYWRAFESGLDICIPSEVCDTVTSKGKVISRFSGRSHDPHFKWDLGFRIGAGYELAWCDWGMAASWTHFHSHSNGFKNHGHELQWNIHFDVIDIIAEYEPCLSSCFALRPFAGLRGARIDQKLHIHEFSCSTSSSVANDLIARNRENKEEFLGLGPLIGLGADWHIGCGFSLYTSVSVSWLYGNFDIRLTECDEFVNAIDSCKVRKDLDANLAGADAAIGIRWHTCLCMNTRLVLQLGLEHHRYFDYNRIGNYGDLSFDGVNFSVGIEF